MDKKRDGRRTGAMRRRRWTGHSLSKKSGLMKQSLLKQVRLFMLLLNKFCNTSNRSVLHDQRGSSPRMETIVPSLIRLGTNSPYGSRCLCMILIHEKVRGVSTTKRNTLVCKIRLPLGRASSFRCRSFTCSAHCEAACGSGAVLHGSKNGPCVKF